MKLLGNDCWWAPRWMKRLQERIGLGEITLEDERKATEAVPEQLDESLAFGTVVGAPTWQKPVHDPSRPTAAALASSGAASAVALADPPLTEPTLPMPATGGGNGDSPFEEPSGDGDGDDDASAESTDEAETVSTHEESAEDVEVETADEDSADDDEAIEEPADDDEAKGSAEE
jgi:RND superfamily putative drug exporter